MATRLHTPHGRHGLHLPRAPWRGHGRAGPRLVAVCGAVCLALLVAGLAITGVLQSDGDSEAVNIDTAAERALAMEMADWLDYQQRTSPADILPDRSAGEPEGRIAGRVDEGYEPLTPMHVRRLNDEMLFREWNDLPGWLAAPERPAVKSSQDTLLLEQNGVYPDSEPAAVASTDESLLPYECTVVMDPVTCLEYGPGAIVPESASDETVLPPDVEARPEVNE